MSSLLDAALAYAAWGLPVFPLAPKRKQPLIPKAKGGRGYKDATCDPDQIRTWWHDSPHANIGAVPGRRRCAVIDVDPHNGGMTTMWNLQQAHGLIPCAALVVTWSNGYHFWLQHPGGQLDEGSSRDRPGVDVKADAGYVVMPPSWVIDPDKRPGIPGNTYRWCRSDPQIQPMPTWLADMLRPPAPPPLPAATTPILPPARGGDRYWLAALEAELRDLAQAPQGTRNDRLHLAAFNMGQLVQHGARPDIIEPALEQVALGIGLQQREVRATIQSGMTAGQKHPRNAP